MQFTELVRCCIEIAWRYKRNYSFLGSVGDVGQDELAWASLVVSAEDNDLGWLEMHLQANDPRIRLQARPVSLRAGSAVGQNALQVSQWTNRHTSKSATRRSVRTLCQPEDWNSASLSEPLRTLLQVEAFCASLQSKRRHAPLHS